MRICVLSDEEMQDFDVSPYLKGYDYEFVTVRRPVMDVLKGLKERNEFDLYLNVCEGYEMDDEDDIGYEGIEVVKALDELGLPFTGTTSDLFDPTREEMQAAADANGVGFAKGYRVHSVDDAKRLVNSLRYPIMVKHPQSYGSTGMIKESRCDSFTLCSIPDLPQALAEVRRVLRPGGEFLFLEHGLSPDAAVARWQRRINPAWKVVGDGCHLDRDPAAAIRESGLEVEQLRNFYLPHGAKFAGYMYLGAARLPA